MQADLAGFKASEQADFIAWFDDIKGQLSEDAAGNLQKQIGTLEALKTEVKTNLVNALNWVVDKTSGVIAKLGSADISKIGDGTVTGAIVNNKEAIEDVSQSLTTKLSLSSFKVVTLGGNTNLNDISECGIYSVPGGLNAPYGDWSIMMVLPINGDANYVHQICFSLGRARPSARAYAYGSWTDWVEL